MLNNRKGRSDAVAADTLWNCNVCVCCSISEDRCGDAAGPATSHLRSCFVSVGCFSINTYK